MEELAQNEDFSVLFYGSSYRITRKAIEAAKGGPFKKIYFQCYKSIIHRALGF